MKCFVAGLLGFAAFTPVYGNCDAIQPPEGQVYCYSPHSPACVEPGGHAAGLVWADKSDPSSALFLADAYADSLYIYRYIESTIESSTPLNCKDCYSWVVRGGRNHRRYKINIYRDAATGGLKNDILLESATQPGQWMRGYMKGTCVER